MWRWLWLGALSSLGGSGAACASATTNTESPPPRAITQPVKAPADEPTPVATVEDYEWDTWTRTVIDTPMFVETWEVDRKMLTPVGFVRARTPVFVRPRRDGNSMDASLSIGTSAPSLLHSANHKSDRFKRWNIDVVLPRKVIPTALSRIHATGSHEFGFFRRLKLGPRRHPFAMIECGRVQRIDTVGDYSLVAVDHYAGELWGWMRDATEWPLLEENGDREWDRQCISEGLGWGYPEEYIRPRKKAFEEAPLTESMPDGSEYFFATHVTGQPPFCQRSRIARAPDGKRLLHFLDTAGDFEYARSLSVSASQVSVHPYILDATGELRATVGGAGWNLRAVRANDSSLGFVSLGGTEETYEANVLRLAPSAIWWWKSTRKRCQERLAAKRELKRSANQVAAKHGLQPRVASWTHR